MRALRVHEATAALALATARGAVEWLAVRRGHDALRLFAKAGGCRSRHYTPENPTQDLRETRCHLKPVLPCGLHMPDQQRGSILK